MSHRVLLCDDEVHILRAAEFKLTKAGYDVFCANNGLEAWEEILRRKPDVLITDCQMPRLDGVGLCQRIRENPETRDLPIFMLTAKGYELSHRELYHQLGVLAVIAKPFSPRELLRRVDEVCLGVDVSGRATTAKIQPSLGGSQMEEFTMSLGSSSLPENS
jgi:two-component system, OmpR family, alkaline phosphatase synthesis response regulator PhoP